MNASPAFAAVPARPLAAVGVEPQRVAEQFLFHEARLMDEHRFDDWLGLWADEALYWVPCNAADSDPSRSVCLIYERRPQIEQRLARLGGRHAHAQSPRSVLIRVVSNIVVESAGDSEICVTSAFALGECRVAEETHWFGRSRHRLIRSGDGWKIAEKKVVMLNNDAPMNNLTFLI